MEARKRRPDAPRLLESTWCEIIETVRVDASKIVIGGRSMGGRIGSQVVAQGIVVDALALFAYPLRPPGNPDKVRNGHFPAEENFYAIKEEELEKLLGGGNWKHDKVVYETDQGFPTNHSVTPNTVTTKK